MTAGHYDGMGSCSRLCQCAIGTARLERGLCLLVHLQVSLDVAVIDGCVAFRYGCSGAGGLAGVFVHERYADDERDRMLGWWSHRLPTRFQMNNKMELDRGAAGYRISNPPVLLVCSMLGYLKVGVES